MTTPAAAIDPKALRRLALKTLLAALAVALLVAVAGFLLRDPIERLTAGIVATLGLAGMGLVTLLSDSLMFPVPPDVLVFAAVAGGSDALLVAAVVSVASVAAGSVAYTVGPQLARLPLLHGWLERHRAAGEAFFARFGVWAVVIAALTPLPYAAFAWLAGIYRMPYRPFVLACLARVLRFFLYLWLFELGWFPGGLIGVGHALSGPQ